MVGAGLPGKALGGIRVAVRIGNVGLDIVDGGAVHQVGTAHDEHRPHVRALLNGLQLYAGKPQRVRPEGRPGGKHAHPGVAAKAWWAHGGRPAFPHCAGKLPHQPDMAEILQSAQGVGVAVFRGKNDLAPQLFYQPALARDAELGGKGGMDMGNDLQGHGFGCLLHDELLAQ